MCTVPEAATANVWWRQSRFSLKELWDSPITAIKVVADVVWCSANPCLALSYDTWLRAQDICQHCKCSSDWHVNLTAYTIVSDASPSHPARILSPCLGVLTVIMLNSKWMLCALWQSHLSGSFSCLDRTTCKWSLQEHEGLAHSLVLTSIVNDMNRKLTLFGSHDWA